MHTLPIVPDGQRGKRALLCMGQQGLYGHVCHEVGLHHSCNTGSQANPVLVVVIRVGASQETTDV